jgi:hypothetical protein
VTFPKTASSKEPAVASIIPAFTSNSTAETAHTSLTDKKADGPVTDTTLQSIKNKTCSLGFRSVGQGIKTWLKTEYEKTPKGLKDIAQRESSESTMIEIIADLKKRGYSDAVPLVQGNLEKLQKNELTRKQIIEVAQEAKELSQRLFPCSAAYISQTQQNLNDMLAAVDKTGDTELIFGVQTGFDSKIKTFQASPFALGPDFLEGVQESIEKVNQLLSQRKNMAASADQPQIKQ